MSEMVAVAKSMSAWTSLTSLFDAICNNDYYKDVAASIPPPWAPVDATSMGTSHWHPGSTDKISDVLAPAMAACVGLIAAEKIVCLE